MMEIKGKSILVLDSARFELARVRVTVGKITVNQERIKGTEKASHLHTLFHR